MAAVAAALDEVAMTRPLRRAHLLAWLLLAPILYAVFVAALLARRPAAPPNPNLHWEQLP